MRTLILGTAGHVDHGKTALVKALTGTDTDRLVEEQRRGISIELGFAHLDLSDELRLAVIDVPGHERFVRQMVAGAGGIDLAMLLVAADEGLKPQTHEHLDILELLGIRSGLVVVTKLDLADRELLPLLDEEIRARVASGFLRDAPILHVSARTGEGLGELRQALLRVGSAVQSARAGDFRLPIDRVFTLEGTGVVVTGTAWSGEVRRDDALRLLPGDERVRVRDVQTHGTSVPVASGGQRVALALHGVKKEAIERGDQLVAGEATLATQVLGVRVRALTALGERVIRQRARLHVHHAAREVLGRLELLEREQLEAGQSDLARLHLEAPLMARPGDRVVLRSYSPTWTVAGAVVLDPQPPQRQRRESSLQVLRELEAAGSAAWPRLQLRRDGIAGAARSGCAARWRLVGCDAAAAEVQTDACLADGTWIVCGERLVSRPALDEMARRLLELLRAHQREAPLSPGLAKESLRQALGVASAAYFQALLEAAGRLHPIFARGDRVRADDAAPALDPKLTQAVAGWEAKIRAAEPAYTPSRADMQDPHVRLLIDRGAVVVLEGPLLAHRHYLDRIATRVRAHFAQAATLDIAAVKEWTGASRKFVVPILEWLDREGLTEFDGKQRRRGPKLN